MAGSRRKNRSAHVPWDLVLNVTDANVAEGPAPNDGNIDWIRSEEFCQ